MPWIIKVYIPVDPDDQEVYASREEAEKDLESLSLMQPENVYKIEEVKGTRPGKIKQQSLKQGERR